MIQRIGFLLLNFAALAASAHVPEIGQLLRFQPQVIRQAKAFSSRGSVAWGDKKLETLLEWQGPGNYRLLVRDVPGALYANGEGSSTWVLIRQNRRCVFKTDTLTVNCSGASFWPLMELAADASDTITALQNAGFLSDNQAIYKETDHRNPTGDEKDRSPVLAIGANGKSPMAVLEIRGPRYRAEAPGEEAPILQFDQTFLSPLLARWPREEGLVTIRALSDFSMLNRKNRWNAIVSSRLEVLSGKMVRTTILRQEPTPAANLSIQMPKAAGDLGTLKDALSVEGQTLLGDLLLTH